MRGSRHWGPFSIEWELRDERGGGRGRARRFFSGDELRLLLLKLIEPAPSHGYDLIRAIEEMSGGAYVPSPGVIYPTLTLLADRIRIAFFRPFSMALPTGTVNGLETRNQQLNKYPKRLPW